MEMKECTNHSCTYSGHEDVCPDCGYQMKKSATTTNYQGSTNINPNNNNNLD